MNNFQKLVNLILEKPTIFVSSKSYHEVCSFLSGYHLAISDSMNGFSEMLVLKYDGGSDLTWRDLALLIIFEGDKEKIDKVSDNAEILEEAFKGLQLLFDEYFSLRYDKSEKDWLNTIVKDYDNWLRHKSQERNQKNNSNQRVN